MLFLRRHWYNVIGLIVPVSAALLAGCSGSKSAAYQGYVEGEYVHVASPVGGRLDKLLVQRGQTVDAKAALFKLEAEQEIAAKQQADEQLKAAQAQLADLKVGRRKPEVAVTQAQLAQAQAAVEQAALQLKRDEAQFDAGGIARAQLDDSRANQAIKAARVRELAGQLEVSRLPAREEQIRAQSAQVAAARAARARRPGGSTRSGPRRAQAGLVVDTLYREGEWVPAGSPVVRLLPPENVKLRFFVPEAAAGGLKPGRKRQRRTATAAAPAVAADGELRRRTSRSSRRRSSTATRRAPSWCSWSRRGPSAENARAAASRANRCR